MDPSVGFVWPKRPSQYRGLIGRRPSIVFSCSNIVFIMFSDWLRLRKLGSFGSGKVDAQTVQQTPRGSLAPLLAQPNSGLPEFGHFKLAEVGYIRLRLRGMG